MALVPTFFTLGRGEERNMGSTDNSDTFPCIVQISNGAMRIYRVSNVLLAREGEERNMGSTDNSDTFPLHHSDL